MKKLFIGIGVLIVLFVTWFYYEAMISPVGPPNPPIAANAECVIQKDARGMYFVLCQKNTFVGSLYITSSKEDLTKYVGKRVRIQAKYRMNLLQDSIETNMQCIANRCQPIFQDKNQKTYAIDIENIKEL